MQLDREHTAAVRAAVARANETATVDDRSPDGLAQLKLVRASSLSVTRVSWCWDHRIPLSAVTLLAGREGLGKTALCGDLAARVTRGQLEGDLRGELADVVYVGTEDDRESVLLPRLIAAGADLDRVHFVTLADGIQFAVEADIADLSAALADLDRTGLVIIDPLDAHLGATIDSHRKAEVQRSLARVALLAQEHRAAVVGIAHLNKGDSRDVLTRVVGSVGFTTSTRSVLGVGPHPEEETDRICVLAKSNVTDRYAVPAIRFRVEGALVDVPGDPDPISTARIVWLGEEPDIDANAVVSGLDSEERTQREECADWLRDYLTAEGAPFREVKSSAIEAGFSLSTLHRAAKRAAVTIRRRDGERGRPSVWSLEAVPEVSTHSHRDSADTKSGACKTEVDQSWGTVSFHVPDVGDGTEAPTLADDLPDRSDIDQLRAHFPNATIEGVTP